MKLIIAYIQPGKLNDVKKVLFKQGFKQMSVTNALGCGQQMGYTETYRGATEEVNLLHKVRVEVAVESGQSDAVVSAIMDGARTGSIGDGKIFVVDLPECITIRTGSAGAVAAVA
jgi:nitrogen regulatory protein P-II 1